MASLVTNRITKVGYIEAKLLVDALRKGNPKIHMPDNREADEMLKSMKSSLRESVHFWTDEMIITPKPGTSFLREDFVDMQEDSGKRHWMLPYSYIPEPAFNYEVALLVKNTHLEVEQAENLVIVIPKEVYIITNMPRQSELWGIPDIITGMPSASGSSLMETDETRQLRRSKHRGIRPVYRIAGESRFEKTIGADYLPGAIKAVCIINGSGGAEFTFEKQT